MQMKSCVQMRPFRRIYQARISDSLELEAAGVCNSGELLCAATNVYPTREVLLTVVHGCILVLDFPYASAARCCLKKNVASTSVSAGVRKRISGVLALDGYT